MYLCSCLLGGIFLSLNHSKQINECLIVGFGSDVPKKPPDIGPNTLIVAADGGETQLTNWGLTPDVLIGDFDSIDPERQSLLESKKVLIKAFPKEKDATDLELAVDYALTYGVNKIILTGVWGGRVDHSLGNLEILYKLAQHKIETVMLTANAKIYVGTNELELELPLATIVSLIPLTEVVTNVSTDGLYYQLQKATLKKGSTKTISNKTVKPCIKISYKHGILLATALKSPRN